MICSLAKIIHNHFFGKSKLINQIYTKIFVPYGMSMFVPALYRTGQEFDNHIVTMLQLPYIDALGCALLCSACSATVHDFDIIYI